MSVTTSNGKFELENGRIALIQARFMSRYTGDSFMTTSHRLLSGTRYFSSFLCSCSVYRTAPCTV